MNHLRIDYPRNGALMNPNEPCGANDIDVLFDLCNQETCASQFSLLVRPVNSRHQNMSGMVRFFSCLWGMDNMVRGRVVEHERTQFLFPSNEATIGTKTWALEF
ncbi:hypothetical protein V5N11_003509 [Cardamine amara subsp. amara]|uniref:Uncharacterized protein n=1 Tax=Cardamine amara subsp. amara TaxID=228776 RepID=A0ABD1C1U4_CARAN